ncbi:MAG: polysaccharide biosynthesis/export family protein [Armatimonadetes bacterium]|nr:polysaccharide biosynthesis/export family protein [Armatimonadota bacterium]
MKMTTGLLLLGLASGLSCPADARGEAVPGERTLVAGDVIRLTVVGEPELTRALTISADGMVSLSYFGRTRIAGLTPDAASDAIRRTLERYIRDPEVSVEVPETRFAVLGAVHRPGYFTMEGDTIPLLDALAQAGGPNDRANLRSVSLVRQTASGPQKVRVDVTRAIKSKATGQLPTVQPGDVLHVDRRGQPLGATLLTILGAAASLGWVLR